MLFRGGMEALDGRCTTVGSAAVSWRSQGRVRDESAPPPAGMLPLLRDPAFRAEWRDLARVEGPKIQKVVWGGALVAMTGSAIGGLLAKSGVIPLEFALVFPQLTQFAMAKYQGEFGALAAIQSEWKHRRARGEDPRTKGRELMAQPRPREGRGRAWVVRGVVAGGAALAGGVYAGLGSALGAAGVFSAALATAWVVKRRGRVGRVAKPKYALADKQLRGSDWRQSAGARQADGVARRRADPARHRAGSRWWQRRRSGRSTQPLTAERYTTPQPVAQNPYAAPLPVAAELPHDAPRPYDPSPHDSVAGAAYAAPPQFPATSGVLPPESVRPGERGAGAKDGPRAAGGRDERGGVRRRRDDPERPQGDGGRG